MAIMLTIFAAVDRGAEKFFVRRAKFRKKSF